MLATVWWIKKGMEMKDIGEGMIFFQFYHQLDLERVLQGMLLGNFVGRIVEYDTSNSLASWRPFMRVKSFCVVCGGLGHTESFCDMVFEAGGLASGHRGDFSGRQNMNKATALSTQSKQDAILKGAEMVIVVSEIKLRVGNLGLGQHLVWSLVSTII
ncbi:hypothetical protein ACS0TY_030883 [Phlomoides rotata]